jgi:hypothetical protein
VTAGLAGRKVLQGPKIPISAEQDENLLARFEVWRATWNGSLPEFITFEFLTIQKKQVPGVDFLFQHPLFGGRTRFGGFLLDFFLVSRREGWRIQGERYHLLKPVDRARGRIARAKLMAEGLTIVDLWESDLLERPLRVLNLAWDQSAEVKSRAPR